VPPLSSHQPATADEDAASREQILLDNLDAAIAIWDKDDRLVRFNDRFADLLSDLGDVVRQGARFEALAYRSIESGLVVPPDGASKEWLKRRLALHRAPGDAFEVELSGHRWFRVKEAHIGAGYTLTSWRNITEDRRDALRLRASEDRFRTLIELSGDAVFVLGGERVMFVNRAGASLLGAETPDELIGVAFDTLLEPETEDGDDAPESDGRLDDETTSVGRFRSTDGRHLWLETRTAEFEDDGRRFTLIIGRDLTARRSASRSLEAAVADAWRTGVEYRSYLQAAVAAGLFPDAFGQEDAWLTERLEQHTTATGPVEIARQDGQWLLLNEHTLPDGGTISIGTDITQRKRAEQRVHFLAHHDSLTGLPNRTLFKDRLEQAIAQAARAERKVAVLMLDLDRFKHINDNLGHSAGDQLLIEVAARLRRCARASDTVARLGGDEFAVVQPLLTGTDQASALARRALDALSDPVVIDGQPVHTGASIGMTMFPDDSQDIDGLLKNSDLALYRAKALAGGRISFYASDLGRRAQERLEIAQGLRQALVTDELVLHYQPKVRLSDGVVVGAEALLRWNHPDRGLLSPAAFIDHAEATGLITAIGEWVLDHTCAQLARWAQRGSLMVPIWVNVSAAQFHDASLLDKVRTTLLGAGVEPRMLGLEITETALMPDASISGATLDRLVELGVELSIDDFGTGYSSLSYLKRFPVGKLKIDQSFVRDITSNPIDAAIARAIIHLGHSLGMHVLAEGVETRQQSNLLSDLGCDQIQGLLVSPPLPEEDFVQFVARNCGVKEPRL
jgi:diguanylate cyclase (GGDEF)-like protein/PAS domain S-box-containing protein